jgi:hypothetical protein
MSDTLRLSDILGRNASIEWFEAVAVVREVGERVIDSAAGRRVPELDQVQLSADGGITMTGASKADDPVRRLGQLLQACLVQSDPPVQLRLTVAQATSPEPPFASVRDLMTALEYFERPDRPAVLRGLFERVRTAPIVVAEQRATLDAIAPLPAGREKETRDEQRRAEGQRRNRTVVAVAALIVLLVAAATAYSQFRGATPSTEEVTTLAVKASDAVGTTLVKGISAVSETVGLGRLVPAGEAPGAPPAAKPTKPDAPAAKPARRKPQRESGDFRVFDLPELPASLPAELSVDIAPVPALAPEPADLVVDETIYSPADSAVAPPIGIRPQLPRVLPEDIRKENLSQIELIILPDGTVGSVKLLGARKSVLEGMLLSAAKAWRFQPATKDGRPVSYRKNVWIALQ